MLTLQTTLSGRYLRQRRLRAALIVASIAVGVAALVATQVLKTSLKIAGSAAANPLAGSADLQILNDDNGVPYDLVRRLREAKVPGVVGIQPLILTRVALPDLKGRSVWLLGVDGDRAELTDNSFGIEVSFNPNVPLSLALLGKPTLLGAELARELETARKGASGEVRVRAGGKDHRLAGVGTVRLKAGGVAAAIGSNLVILRRADAGPLVFPSGRELVSRIDLGLSPDADREAVKRAVAEVVGDRADVSTPEAIDRAVMDLTAGLELGFDLGSAGALVVGLFLVYNALAFSVAERRHDIGVLRSQGATRGQVAGLFAFEGGFLGAVGSVLGLPLGLGLAALALGPLQRLLGDVFLLAENPGLRVTPTTLLVAFLAGLATSLGAALGPALDAAGEEPADAVRRVPRVRSWKATAFQAGSSLFFLVGGLASIQLREHLPLRWGAFGGIALVLIGLLVASPLATSVLARLFQPLARNTLGVAGRLAADNLARASGRTGIVIGALAASVALMVQTAGVSLSTERGLLTWLERRVAADLLVTSSGPLMGGTLAQPMEEAVGEQLAADAVLADRIARVVPIRLRPLTYSDRIVVIVAFDAAQAYEKFRDRQKPEGVEQYPRLAAEKNAVLVSENFANLYRVRIGDQLTLRGVRGPVTFRVIGTLLDYTWNRGTILMDRRQYVEHFDDRLIDLFHVYVRPGVDPDGVRDGIVARYAGEHALFAATQGEVRQGIADLLRSIDTVSYAQQLVIGLVVVLGVVIALLISVLQRRRELGLLRAVGADGGQIVRTVLAEALLMGWIGALLGVAAGLVLEWYVVQMLIPDEAGFGFPMVVPWKATAVVTGLAVATATLAGLGPAWQALRLRITDAIAYE